MKCQLQSHLASSRKQLRLGDFQQIDSAVLTCFKGVKVQSVPMSGPMIQEKARQFAAILEVTDFEASCGWFHCFRQWNAITWHTVSGEEKAADEAAAAMWREETFWEMVASYRATDVFNADETACFYQLLHFKGKNAKAARNQRANKRAWMTRELFTEWLLSIDKMKKEGQNILMIVDNCSALIVNVRFTNVHLEYLPPNCTSVLQPLDQGIIRSKGTLRKRLVQRVLINLRLKQSSVINVRQDAEMLTGAWWSVTSTTIKNCWKKAGLMQGHEQSQDAEQPQNAVQAEEGDPGELWSEVTELLAVDSVSFDDYVLCDEATMTSAELTTEDIVQSIRDDEGSDNGMNDGVADNEGGTAAPELCDETVTTADMMDIVQKFRIFLGKSSTAIELLHRNVDELESFVLQNIYQAKLEAQGMPRTYAEEARCQVTKWINEKMGDLRKLEDRRKQAADAANRDDELNDSC
ncbi:tigger transposable element-derived protein 6-like [Ixodes scapularis]